MIYLQQGCLLPGVLATCKPDCTGKNPGDKVEDPKDCRNYYICMSSGPTDHTLSCGAVNHFDPELGECASGTACFPSCVLPPCHLTCTDNIDLISDPFDCSMYYVCLAGGVVGESYRCPNDKPYFDGKFCVGNEDTCCSELCTPYCYSYVVQAPDPKNCTKYYICEHEGQPDESHHFSCGKHEVFDVSVGRCVKGAQCKTLCGDERVVHVPPVRPHPIKY